MFQYDSFRQFHATKMDAGMQKFCLQWNEFKGIVTSEFYNLREHEDFVDVTLCCEGRQLKAHRLMLSVCSAYFKEVLKVRNIFTFCSLQSWIGKNLLVYLKLIS